MELNSGSVFIPEMIGTALLVLLGCGVVAGVLLAKSKAENAGWVVITFGWGFAVMVGAGSVADYGGAQLNPAVTLGVWANSGFGSDFGDKVPIYIAGQFVGAFIGATLVYLAYLVHWKDTEDSGLKLAVFSTGPAIRNTAANLITEIIGTFVLVFGILAIRATRHRQERHRRAVRRVPGGRYRDEPRWPDGLCDQPRPRPRPTHHARDPPDSRQGRFRLGRTPGFRSWDR